MAGARALPCGEGQTDRADSKQLMPLHGRGHHEVMGKIPPHPVFPGLLQPGEWLRAGPVPPYDG